MSRKDGHAVKEAFTRRIRFPELEPDRVTIDLRHHQSFAIDDKQVSLGGVNLRVEIDGE